jgi:hypothetical protein
MMKALIGSFLICFHSMAEETTENEFENEGGATQPDESSAQPVGGGTQSPAPAGVSPEEFYSVAQRQTQMEQWIAENFFVDEPEPDAQQGDPRQYVDQRLAAIEPVIQGWTQERGDKEFNKQMDELEKDPTIGKIHNRAIAFHFAEQSWDEAGGNAKRAVKLGAQKAAAYERELREAGRKELQKTASREAPGDGEFGPALAGPGRKDYKSYEEVRDAWAAETEL